MESVDPQSAQENSDNLPIMLEITVDPSSVAAHPLDIDQLPNDQDLERRFRHAQIVSGQQRMSRHFARGPLSPEQADKWRYEIERRKAMRKNQNEPE